MAPLRGHVFVDWPRSLVFQGDIFPFTITTETSCENSPSTTGNARRQTLGKKQNLQISKHEARYSENLGTRIQHYARHHIPRGSCMSALEREYRSFVGQAVESTYEVLCRRVSTVKDVLPLFLPSVRVGGPVEY